MRNRVVALVGVMAFAFLTFAPAARSQQSAAGKDQNVAAPAAQVLRDGWGRVVTKPAKDQKPASAPRHDISGIWEPAKGPGDGIQPNGPKDMPYDGKPEHDPPYTPLGLQTLKSHKALFG